MGYHPAHLKWKWAGLWLRPSEAFGAFLIDPEAERAALFSNALIKGDYRIS